MYCVCCHGLRVNPSGESRNIYVCNQHCALYTDSIEPEDPCSCIPRRPACAKITKVIDSNLESKTIAHKHHR